jgi:hypothetical protein
VVAKAAKRHQNRKHRSKKLKKDAWEKTEERRKIEMNEYESREK